jgi:small lipoprotein (TIGR04454 family)
MRHIARISIALFFTTVAACGGKGLSKDQCDKLVDKAIQIQAGGNVSPDMLETIKKAAGDQLKDLTDKCTKELTQSQYDCAMKASTMTDLMKCDDN